MCGGMNRRHTLMCVLGSEGLVDKAKNGCWSTRLLALALPPAASLPETSRGTGTCPVPLITRVTPR